VLVELVLFKTVCEKFSVFEGREKFLPFLYYMDAMSKYKEYYEDYIDLCERLDAAPMSFVDNWEAHKAQLLDRQSNKLEAEAKNESELNKLKDI
jgi:hypothetical protein